MKNKALIITTIILSATLGGSSSMAQSSFTANPQTACSGFIVEFTNTTAGSYKFAHFDFGDGTDSYGDKLQHIYAKPGEYTVSMWILNNDDTHSDPVTQTVTIAPTPTLELTDDKAMSQITVTTDQSVEYTWYLGNNKLDVTSNPLFYYESGTYSVTITNSSGCTASAEIRVNALGAESINNTIIKVANNVITPGVKDGINDVLYIEDIADYQHPCSVEIFNKLGKKVYTNANYSNTDGFQGNDDDGNELFAGTYYYVIKSEGRKGVTGFVDLIR